MSETQETPSIVGAYALTIHAPSAPLPHSVPGLAIHLHRFMRETEENLTDILPNGWWVEIHEWDEGVNDA